MRKITENTFINGRTVADYIVASRAVKISGKRYALISWPRYEQNRLNPEDEHYYSYAVLIGDEIGQMEIPGGSFPYTNLYVIEWDLSPNYNPDDGDEGNACEWDKPRAVHWFSLVDLTDGRDF